MPKLVFSRLRSVLTDKGPNPQHHDLIEERHRREWPLLWAAIDELMALDAASPPGDGSYYDSFGKFHPAPEKKAYEKDLALPP